MAKINEVSTREFSDRYETKLKLKCSTFRPTPFEIDIRNIEIKITDVIKDIDYENYTNVFNQIKYGDCCTITKKFQQDYSTWISINPYAGIIINYIIANIKYNHNWIEINKTDIIKQYPFMDEHFNEAINGLIFPNRNKEFAPANALLIRSNIENLYIVNHNHIFKGIYRIYLYCLYLVSQDLIIDEDGAVINND